LRAQSCVAPSRASSRRAARPSAWQASPWSPTIPLAASRSRRCWEIGHGLAVGSGAALQNLPALQAVRAGELPEQAGLADSGLADHRAALAVPGLRFLHGLVELLDLAVASDEAGEPARGGSVEPRADRSRPDDLVDLDRFGKALHRHRPACIDPD